MSHLNVRKIYKYFTVWKKWRENERKLSFIHLFTCTCYEEKIVEEKNNLDFVRMISTVRRIFSLAKQYPIWNLVSRSGWNQKKKKPKKPPQKTVQDKTRGKSNTVVEVSIKQV